MSRALQIKQTGELLGVKLKITDEDIQQAFFEIINDLHVEGNDSLLVSQSLVVSFKQIMEDFSNSFFVYLFYDKLKNDLTYTEFFTAHVKRCGFKMTSQKFHSNLIIVINKILNVKIGRVHPHMRYKKYPVC